MSPVTSDLSIWIVILALGASVEVRPHAQGVVVPLFGRERPPMPPRMAPEPVPGPPESVPPRTTQRNLSLVEQFWSWVIVLTRAMVHVHERWAWLPGTPRFVEACTPW